MPPKVASTMDAQTRDTLRRLEADIFDAPRYRLLDGRDWAREVPPDPGVYVVWDKTLDEPVYVGETSSLAHRMRDIAHWENHTCRRKLAAVLKIARGDEHALSAALAEAYTISFLALSFGRVEFEEYLRVRWGKSVINSPARRMARVYAWVPAALPREQRPRPRRATSSGRQPNRSR